MFINRVLVLLIMVEKKSKTHSKKALKNVEDSDLNPKTQNPNPESHISSHTSPESQVPHPIFNILSGQPEINIGMVGHVDHGKTSLVESLSGKWTDTHSEELRRGITIRLGYADIVIYKIPGRDGFDQWTIDKNAGGVPARKISLVDAPGHESLMATMLSGANIMDAALLLVSASDDCPQPQTREHVMALQIMGLKNVIVVQNKIDIVSEDLALKNYNQIKKFLADTDYKDAPIIPLSAKYNLNIDVLLGMIQELFKTPKHVVGDSLQFFVARSFDVNKPGTSPDNLKGGILGGVIKHGVLSVGDEVEILPGYSVKEKNQDVWKPLTTTIQGIIAGGQSLEKALPGGSLGIMTTLDPSIVGSDKLVGSIVGHPGKLPVLWSKLTLKIKLLERIVGAKDDLLVNPIIPGEFLMLNVNSSATVGIVKLAPSKEKAVLDLKRPVCADKGSRVAISRNVGQRWRLIGYGVIE